MYFNNIPNIQYDTKPISFPFKESDYVLAKNFFKRYKVNEDAFSYSVFFKKYIIQDGERIDTVAEKIYGDAELDWVIVITNNIINPLFDWPISEYELRKNLELEYDDPYSIIKHYKTYEIKNSLGNIALQKDLIVDQAFYNRPFKYWDSNSVATVSGSIASYPVTLFDYESEMNEKKREIFILKGAYLQSFLGDFKKNNLYKKSSDYIDRTTKKTGV